MTCNQLGGACDLEFRAETFEEIAALSRKHGTDMYQKGDQAHLAAIGKMQELMKTPGGMDKWFADKKAEFDNLAAD